VPELETYHLERPYARQMPVLEHTAGEFFDSSEPSKIGTRITAARPSMAAMMERIERCLCGITAAMSAGEWFGFATDSSWRNYNKVSAILKELTRIYTF